MVIIVKVTVCILCAQVMASRNRWSRICLPINYVSIVDLLFLRCIEILFVCFNSPPLLQN